jgi:hypothetical protein
VRQHLRHRERHEERDDEGPAEPQVCEGDEHHDRRTEGDADQQ